MDHFDRSNVFIVSIAVAVVVVIATVCIAIGAVKSSQNNADVAQACIESDGTWIDATSDCLGA